MQPETPLSELYDFVLEHAGEETSLAKRARICRALALIIGNEENAHALNQLADECEQLLNSHEQLLLNFRAQTAAGRRGLARTESQRGTQR